MKKFIISGLAVAALSGTAFAQDNDTASLEMAAQITERCEISLVGTSPNVLFGLDQTVANVDTVCNLPGDVTVQISSANFGNLVNQSAGGGSIPYTVDLTPNNVTSGGFPDGLLRGDNQSIATPLVATVPGGALLGGAQFDVRVNIDNGIENDGQVFAGTYADTLTFEIGAAGSI